MKTTCETISFAGLKNCARLTNGEVELVVTTGFGPRVLSYGFIGKRNVFKIFEEQLKDTTGDAWKSYGGHRLWHAPEVFPRTYYPDNDAVPWEWTNGVLILKCPIEKGNNIGKAIKIALAETGTRVEITHVLRNEGVWPVKVAAWCLSVMAAGGEAIVPQEPYRSHPECLVPARPLVLWHFTKMSDRRFTWGERYIRLREDSGDKTKQKFGVLNKKGWAAYVFDDVAFVKKTPFVEGAEYTDMGCNQEYYTEAGFLEMESLSPYTELACGGALTHVEKWALSAKGRQSTDAELDSLGSIADGM
jgi:hypothetical protein